MAHFSHAYLEGCSIYFTFVGLAGAPGGASDVDDLEGAEARYDSCWNAALSAACDAGATISHHHGIGLARAPWMAAALGEAAFDTLVALKRALDPAGILNPGKLGLPSPFLPDGWAWS
jgi:alkyldihydroxyacetonephosphate synthase